MTPVTKAFFGLISLMMVNSGIALGAPQFDPWDFNVYTTGNIGTSTNAYSGSDFQGVTGSQGSDYFSGFSINLNNTSPISGPSLYAGGTVNFSNGTISNGGIESTGAVNVTNTTVNGGINAGGTVTQTNGQQNGNVNTAGAFVGNSPTVNGNVSTGGNFTGSGGGQVSGNVSAGGTISGNTTIQGTALSHQTPATFTPTLNLATVSSFFQNANTFWGNLTANLSVSNNQYGVITVSNALNSGRNILDLTLAQINAITNSTQNYEINFTGNVPTNAFVVINVLGSGTAMNSLQLSGISASDVLFNIVGNAITNLTLNGGNYVSLLAPNTNINFTSGLLTGNLIADNLTGQGQVDNATFAGFPADANNITPVPEPATYAIMGSMLGIVAFVAHRKKGQEVEI